MTDSKPGSTIRKSPRATRRPGFLNGWTALALVSWGFLGLEGVRPTPRFEDLVEVTARVERQGIDEAELHFWLKGVEKKFVVHAESLEGWYTLVAACEQGAELSLWTRPAVAENRLWPLASFFDRLPWQIEYKGELLQSYAEQRQRRSAPLWLLRCAFLAFSAGLAWRWHRMRNPLTEESHSTRRTRPRREHRSEEPAESEEPEQGNRAGRWFWNLLGLGLSLLVLYGVAKERSDDSYPIPSRTDLVEKVGSVTDVEVKVINKSRGQRSSSLEEITGLSFGLEGDPNRWSIYKGQWRYDQLARQLAPGAQARLLVHSPEWLETHGAPPRNEDLWAVVVAEEPILSLEQQLSLVRKRREKKTSPQLLAVVAAAIAACFIQGYRVGRPGA